MKPWWILALILCLIPPLQAEEPQWVDAAMHDALVGALTGRTERVSSVRSVLDEENLNNLDSWTGVADDVAVLEILSGTGTQKEKAEQLQKLAAELNDPIARERLLDLSKRSNDYRLEQLIKKRRMNRYSSVINRTWQTTSQVLTGQPSALGVAGIDVAKAVTGKSDVTLTDRKIAHLAELQEIRGEVEGKDLEKGREHQAKVEKKKDRELKRNWVGAIERAERDEDWWRVREFSLNGSELWPDDPFFQERLSLAEGKLFESAASPEGQEQIAPAAPSPEAEVIRRKIVAESGQPFIPTADSRTQIARAEANRRNQTLDYLVFGDATVGNFSERSAKTAIVHGGDAPAAMALFQAAETVFRAATLSFGNDLGVNEAIETYARIEEENPEALSRRDYLRWADLYSKKDRDNKAIELLERKGIEDKRRIAKYRKKWAEGIIARCRDLPPSKERFKALEYVRDDFSETSAAKEARKLLQESPATDRSLARIEVNDLREFRPELTAAGFLLLDAWWDGEKENGEIEGKAVFWDDETGDLWHSVQKGSPWRKVEHPEESRERLNAVFSKVEDFAFARGLKQERATGRRFPIEIEGALGGGAYITPRLVQFDLSDPDDLYYE